MESASGVEVPADHDLLTWLMPCAASMLRRVAVGRDGKTGYERGVERSAVPPLAQFRGRVWWMPLQPSNRCLGPLDSRFEQGRYLGAMDGSNTVLVGTAKSGESQFNQTVATRPTIEWQLVGRSTRQRIGTKCTGRRWR